MRCCALCFGSKRDAFFAVTSPAKAPSGNTASGASVSVNGSVASAEAESRHSSASASTSCGSPEVKVDYDADSRSSNSSQSHALVNCSHLASLTSSEAGMSESPVLNNETEVVFAQSARGSNDCAAHVTGRRHLSSSDAEPTFSLVRH